MTRTCSPAARAVATTLLTFALLFTACRATPDGSDESVAGSDASADAAAADSGDAVSDTDPADGSSEFRDADGSGDATDVNGGDVPVDAADSLVVGGDRPARVVLPADYDAEGQWPVVLLLHGYGAGANLQAAYWGLFDVVDELGIILVLPDGTVDETGRQFWDAWPACCNFYGADVDDVAYLDGLLDELEERYSVDTNRVYAAGHSNGGYMSYRLACDLGDRLAGIMALAGTMPFRLDSCADNGSVAVLHVHGTDDERVPYDPEAGSFRTGAYDSAAFWAERNGCDDEPTDGEAFDLTIGSETETVPTVWSGCGRDVELWTLNGVDHIPAFGSAWSKGWVTWLLDRPRP